MKTEKFTNEQLQAINGKDCSIIVSAAAGSGKTSVLIERLVRLLSDSVNKVYADRIIVVTYTKNAASEMKQRLIKAINEQIDLYPNNDWLIKQHSMLQSAKISTIHSFCFDLIRDNINSLDISIGFKIIEPTEEKVLCFKAISETIEDMYTQNLQEMLFLTESICDKTDDNLEDLLFNLYNFLISVPFFQDWLEEKCIKYYSKDDIQNDDALNNLFQIKIESLKECINWIDMCIELCQEVDDDKCLRVLDKDYNDIKNFIDILSSHSRYDADIIDTMANYSFCNFSKSKDNPYKESLQAYRNIYKKIFNDKDSKTKISFNNLSDVIRYYSDDKSTNKRISQIIYKLICSIHDKVKLLKFEENVLSFSDAEQLAITLLATKDSNGNIIKTELAKRLSDYYQIILVDEFQDSNNNQDLIFKMISKDGSANRMGTNMFVVGDIKQSIYNFRLANPENFKNALKNSKPYVEKKPPRNSNILLNKNFRSSIDVINLVNYAFENLMSDEIGEVTYNDSEKLIYGAKYPEYDRSTEIAIIDTDKYSEAEYIANTIKSMLNSKYPVVERDGSVRACRQSDFCMLFMDTTKISSYFEKLQEIGISANFKQNEEFLKSREVSLLFNMIKIVSNPMDNIALTSIMMSPIFMFTPDDISIIRLLDRNSSIYSSVIEISKDVEYKTYSKELITKIKYLLDTLNTLRNLSASCTTYELMTNIIDITDFISIMQVYDTSNTRRKNIQIFLKLAQTYDNRYTTGITGFIRYINNILDLKQDINISNNTSPNDSVNIQTIHKSKGLEYPFVFLCNSDKKFNENDTKNIIQTSFNYGLAYKLKDRTSLVSYNTVDSLRISNLKSLERRSEKMRLMYVALTRAKERLFIPLSLTKNKTTINKVSSYIDIIKYENKIPSYLVKKADNMQDWLLMLLCCSKNASVLNKYLELPNYGIIDCNARLNIYEYNPKVETSFDNIETINDVPFKVIEPLKQKILSNCKFIYTNKKADLPARISVSNIVKSENVVINNTLTNINSSINLKDSIESENCIEDLRTPNFMLNTTMTPAEKGTAIHKIMQYCNFKNLKSDLNKELNRLLINGYITQEQYNIIDIDMFNKLINSDIFDIMLNNPVQRERDFLVKVSDLKLKDSVLDIYKDTDTMLQGTIDMLIFEPDGITLLDYKTDNVYSLDVLKQRYSLSLKLYKSAMELIENTPLKRALIYSMKLGKTIEIQ